MSEIEEMAKRLPPDLRIQAINFIEFLLERKMPKRRVTLRQNWAGALGDLKKEYTSLDLQKKALDWRGE
ncbi:MAG: DUF2281 domain-containing protein [Methanoregula sp.]|nr:DUF2281 domain-containing protein [Methanoregula sp.]MDD5187812.1 DUF2281 domain-containing protein [Methanoregula sp.]